MQSKLVVELQQIVEHEIVRSRHVDYVRWSLAAWHFRYWSVLFIIPKMWENIKKARAEELTLPLYENLANIVKLRTATKLLLPFYLSIVVCSTFFLPLKDGHTWGGEEGSIERKKGENRANWRWKRHCQRMDSPTERRQEGAWWQVGVQYSDRRKSLSLLSWKANNRVRPSTVGRTFAYEFATGW